MELKRFVLLNDYNLILDSKNEEELRVVHYADGDEVKVVVDNWYYPLAKLDYKDSDNILDFVELGDLVETPKDIQRVEIIEEDRYVLEHTRTHLIVINKKNVIAIYKRQANGDYKKYEVKE